MSVCNYSCIPMHITALYVFLVVNVLLLVNITLVDANVFVTGQQNETRRGFYDLPANFGPAFPNGGLKGYTVRSQPIDGCKRISPPPYQLEQLEWIVLIQRGGCVFDRKVLNAQIAGYSAAIVYNVNSSSLLPMGGDPLGEVLIPSCFVGSRDGYLLSYAFNYTSGFVITIDNDVPFDGTYYLLPLAVVLGICFILMLLFMIVKWLRDIHKRRKSRLSKKQLNKVPTKTFEKGDDYDVCAVCLDDYEEGQKLRVLPCSHVYHITCIDPWLLQNKPTCPICKRKVIASLPDPDSEQPDSDEEEVDEDTPLLRQSTSRGRPSTFGAINPVHREPTTIVYETDEEDSDAVTEDSELSDYGEGATGGHVTPIGSGNTSSRAAVHAKPGVTFSSGLPIDSEESPIKQTEEQTNRTDEITPEAEISDTATKTETAPEPDEASEVVAPSTPLEPEVIVQTGRHSINNTDGRDFDGVV